MASETRLRRGAMRGTAGSLRDNYWKVSVMSWDGTSFKNVNRVRKCLPNPPEKLSCSSIRIGLPNAQALITAHVYGI